MILIKALNKFCYLHSLTKYKKAPAQQPFAHGKNPTLRRQSAIIRRFSIP
ncbi:hypothetical protein HMPREF9120_02264 [Neisseria sp. oral taxon 020 str. F0370]|nr:hypothetical protein HMPREF9120_02264 [Neisseria sp. oral taxon 020 str. F0370]